MKKLILLSLTAIVVFYACKKDTKTSTTTNNTTTNSGARLRFVLKLDSTQVRLDNIGQPSNIPSNHQAQNPQFNKFGAHYIELTMDDTTRVGGGTILYVTPTKTTSPVVVSNSTSSVTYTTAIDFSQLPLESDGGEIYSVPLSQVKPGNYKWFRMSVAYQNYDINYVIKQGTTVNGYTFPSDYYGTGTLASFIAYQSYVNSYTIKTQSVNVSAAKMQGYWGFETPFTYTVGTQTYTYTPTPYSTGQAPSGSTTVVNPLFNTSSVPPGSCLVTAQFVNTSNSPQLLTITGNETKDITVNVSVSTNHSFEWVEHTGDMNYNPLNGDTVTDMGVRGLIPIIQQ